MNLVDHKAIISYMRRSLNRGDSAYATTKDGSRHRIIKAGRAWAQTRDKRIAFADIIWSDNGNGTFERACSILASRRGVNQ